MTPSMTTQRHSGLEEREGRSTDMSWWRERERRGKGTEGEGEEELHIDTTTEKMSKWGKHRNRICRSTRMG
jgi:hypothetical protein